MSDQNILEIDCSKLKKDKELLKLVYEYTNRCHKNLLGYNDEATYSVKYSSNYIDSLLKNSNCHLFLNMSEKYIKEACFVVKGNKSCEIHDLCFKLSDVFFKRVMEKVKDMCQKDNKIWISIPIYANGLPKIVSKYISYGFSYPYITSKSPLGIKLDNVIALTIQPKLNNNLTNKNILDRISYLLSEFSKGKETPCEAWATLTKSAVKFLKKLPQYKTETVGKLVLNDPTISDDKLIYKVNVDKKSFNSGGVDEIDYIETRYNFHSHPENAYIKYNTDFGWPSKDDYCIYILGFLTFSNAFHCVSTMEGIYVINLNKKIINKMIKLFKDSGKKIIDDKIFPFVERSTHVDKANLKINKIFKMKFKGKEYKINSIPSYLDYINKKVCYIDSTPLFRVQFFTWKELENGVNFNFYFPKISGNCFVTEEEISMHKL